MSHPLPKTMNWKDIPLPPKMQGLPRDHRGYPIPHIVLRDATGKAIFTANDMRVVAEVIVNRLCNICGKALGNDAWFVGGPKSAFHEHGAFLDPPIHHECGEYALKVCPYLATSTYKGDEKLVEKVAKKLKDSGHGLDASAAVLVNHTQTMNLHVPFHVFAKANIWGLTPHGYMIPHRPYLKVEYWKDGQRLSRPEALELLGESDLELP